MNHMRSSVSPRKTGYASRGAEVITLGTAGGPAWWADSEQGPRQGISTAVKVGDRHYLVDLGMGAARQMTRANLDIRDLGAVFITHMHSDHLTDLANLVLFGMYRFDEPPSMPIKILGPGDPGSLPPLNPLAPQADRSPDALGFSDGDGTPGIRESFRRLLGAYATDLQERIRDSLRQSPGDLFEPSDIALPGGHIPRPGQDEPPQIDPFKIFEDERVRVSATLVKHPPVWPAFAFRFDTDGGSVVVSGDTAPCQNLEKLADGADLLLHEAIDPGYIERRYENRMDPLSVASRDHHYRSHTTPRAAGELAENAGVKTLVLHHLVPGDGDIAVWREAESTFNGRLIVPHDLERIRIGA